MNSLFIKDFRFGLDTRKSELTQKPGSLEVFTNGFVNQGGEIENRKAFVRTARVSGSYGLQSTAAGLLTFGSGASGGFPVLNIGTVSIPINVTYQRLQHPSQLVTSPIAYDAAKHLLDAVSFSTEYRGKAFVVAHFTDGNSFCYYDGLLMYDFTDGLVLAYMVNDTTAIAAAVAAMVDRTTSYSATSASAIATLVGPLGQAYDTVVTEDAAGTMIPTKSSDPTDAISARVAVGSFTVVAGSSSPGTNKITQVEVNSVVITNAAVNWTTSNEVTAGLLATSINTYTGGTDYTAEAIGSTVSIKALTGTDATPNDYVVKVTTAGDVCIGLAQYQVFIDGGLPFSLTEISVGGVDVAGALTASSAGYTPATYAAAIATAINAGTTAGAAHGILCNATGAIVSLSKNVTRSDDPRLQVIFIQTGTRPGNGVYEKDLVGGPTTDLSALILVTGVTKKNSGNGYIFTWTITLIATGGVKPYLPPVWVGAATVPDATHCTVTRFNSTAIEPTMPTVFCTVTDSATVSVRSNNLP